MELLQRKTVTLIIIEDIFTNRQTAHTGDNLRDLLIEHCHGWQDTWHLYANFKYRPSVATELAFVNEEDLEALVNVTEGIFGVVKNPPQGPAAIPLIVALVVSVAAAILLRPTLPQPTSQKGKSSTGSQGTLGERKNEARPLERIPDHYGEKWIIPDIIAAPYRVYEGGLEVEYTTVCLGRGNFEIYEVHEGDTDVTSIQQMSVAIVGAGRQLGAANTRPYWESGSDISTTPPKEVRYISAVKNIAMDSPRTTDFTGSGLVLSRTGRIVFPANMWQLDPTPPFGGPYGEWVEVKPDELFKLDDRVVLTNVNVPVKQTYTDIITFYKPNVITSALMLIGSVPVPAVGDSVIINGHSTVLSDSGTPISLDGEYTVTAVSFDYKISINLNKNVYGEYVTGDPSRDWEYFNASSLTELVSLDTTIAVRKASATVAVTGVLKRGGEVNLSSGSFPSLAVGDYLFIRNYRQTVADVIYNMDGLYRVSAKTSNTVFNLDLSKTSGAYTYGNPSRQWDDYNAMSSDFSSRTFTIIVNDASNTNTVSFDGEYVVIGAGANYIDVALDDIELRRWSSIGSVPVSLEGVSSVTCEGLRMRGVYKIDDPALSGGELVCNFVADKGAYVMRQDGSQLAYDIRMIISVSPFNASGAATGTIVQDATIRGSATDKNARGVTATFDLPVGTTRIWVQATRYTAAAEGVIGNFSSSSEDVIWRDAFFRSTSTRNGDDVTTALIRAVATPFSTSLQERRINMRVCSILKDYTTDGKWRATSHPLNIFMAMALDPYIAKHPMASIDDVDIGQILNTINEAEAYFGIPLRLGLTFDDINTSFEEMAQTVAGACFSQAYRQGSKILWRFEKPSALPTVVFNARNVVPHTFFKTLGFGAVDDKDSIEITYYDKDDKDTPVTITLPVDGGVNPTKEDLVGVRDSRIAMLHAWRLYNKMIKRIDSFEIIATDEAYRLLPEEHIAIADLTNADTVSGELKSVAVLTLTTSVPVPTLTAGDGWMIYLQHYDLQSEIIPVASAGGSSVILAYAPRLPLIVDRDEGIITTFILTSSTSPTVYHCAVQTTDLQQSSGDELDAWKVSAVNYDATVYDHDQMYNT